MRQLKIDFQPDVLVQFPDFWDCVRASVYDCGRPFKNIAADLNMSPSRLSRMLSVESDPDDDGDKEKVRHFPLRLLPKLMEATGDYRPLYWLIESFLEDPAAKKQRVVEELSVLSKRMGALLSSVEGELPGKGRR